MSTTKQSYYDWIEYSNANWDHSNLQLPIQMDPPPPAPAENTTVFLSEVLLSSMDYQVSFFKFPISLPLF